MCSCAGTMNFPTKLKSKSFMYSLVIINIFEQKYFSFICWKHFRNFSMKHTFLKTNKTIFFQQNTLNT